MELPTEQPYKINTNEGNYIELNNDFMLNTGISNEDHDFDISPDDYVGGSFFLVFDRTKDKCNRFHRHNTDSGSIDINLKLRTPLTKTATVKLLLMIRTM